MFSRLARAFRPVDRHPSRRGAACLREGGVRGARHRSCSACATACPRDALDAATLAVNEDRCAGCHRCAVACPTGALQPTPAFREGFLRGWQRLVRGGTFRVGCSLARDDGAPFEVVVLCLAGVPWEADGVALALGARDVELVRGDCGACALGAGAAAQSEAERQGASRAARAWGLGEVRFRESGDDASPERGRPRNADPTTDRRVSRRQLFRSLRDRGEEAGRQLGAACSEEVERLVAGDPETPTEGAAPRSAVPWPRAALARLIASGDEARPVSGLSRAGRPAIDAARCERCGLCVSACPTRAIRREGGHPSNPSAGIVLLAHRCVGCGSCQEACRAGAMRVGASVDLNEWSARPPILLTGTSRSCAVCGDEALVPARRLCLSCYRAGRRPGGATTFVKGREECSVSATRSSSSSS